ncbi:hypothetical protein [Kutzneria chonburiensis]|uniref:GNAT family N-acetyltransferase n=1 Tax=Kutzneria chonburiensis TaxID=1483604 RepID=A0ABV6N819_9PSEU|nr:hypothetical protein [Kutzneria chonburiensis]
MDRPDLAQLAVPAAPDGLRLGPIEESGYLAAWRTVVDSSTGADAIPHWTYDSFQATADPTCWRAAYDGNDMVGVALGTQRPNGVGTANPHRSYDLYESVGFQRLNEYVRYRKALT